MSEVYISVDIETDGPIPAANSMLSVGAAAYDHEGQLLDTFTVNLQPLIGAHQDPGTMTGFWEKNPEAWEAVQENPVAPVVAMQMFAGWLLGFKDKGTLVYVGYPVTFDFSFTHWYFHNFIGKDPFGFSGLDLKTYAMAILEKTSFRSTSKGTMPKAWFKTKGKHTHIALEDALEQGQLFFEMRKHQAAGQLAVG